MDKSTALTKFFEAERRKRDADSAQGQGLPQAAFLLHKSESTLKVKPQNKLSERMLYTQRYLLASKYTLGLLFTA
ncbi:unnamed protein product [Rodentolepis nana]|uniref:XRE family transcriptional regulator n=1 Tax=Rodentolepis nana TaxID=102285 RepID=A0A0R3TPM1_RODNA|nr:unnamed protein product [Rodentolepis nana]